MPLYEYLCPWCSRRMEISHLMNHKADIICPKCVKPMDKLMSSPQVGFKGSGFYSTDK